MSRVLLIGTGPLPEDGPRELGFPQLRARQFLRPLLGAGHDVMLATLTRRDLLSDRDRPAVNEPGSRSLDVGGAARSFTFADLFASFPRFPRRLAP